MRPLTTWSEAPESITDVKGTNAYQQISDERFKTDVHTLDQSLEKLRRMRGVRFRFNQEAFPGRNFEEEAQVRDYKRVLTMAQMTQALKWDEDQKEEDLDKVLSEQVQDTKVGDKNEGDKNEESSKDEVKKDDDTINGEP